MRIELSICKRTSLVYQNMRTSALRFSNFQRLIEGIFCRFPSLLSFLSSYKKRLFYFIENLNFLVIFILVASCFLAL